MTPEHFICLTHGSDAASHSTRHACQQGLCIIWSTPVFLGPVPTRYNELTATISDKTGHAIASYANKTDHVAPSCSNDPGEQTVSHNSPTDTPRQHGSTSRALTVMKKEPESVGLSGF